MKTRSDASLPWPWIGAVALCSLAVTLVFLRAIPSGAQVNEGSDYLYFYEPVAKNLAAGKGLVTNAGTVAMHYPPGYPLLLAATFKLAAWLTVSPETTNLGLTLLCHALAAVFVFLLARKLWSNSAAMVAALAWISYPPILWLTKQPNSEIPFMAVFYAGVLLLWSAYWRRAGRHLYFLAGVLGGAAALIRPIGLGAMVIMVLGLLIATRGQSLRLRLTLTGLLLLGNFAAIFPWQVWVYARTGRVVLLAGNLVPSIRDGLRFAVTAKSYRQTISVPDDVRAMMQRLDTRFSELNSLPGIAAVVAEEARPQPMALVKLLGLKLARSWYATDSGRREGLILLFQIFYLGLTFAGGWRAWRTGGRARQLLIGLGLTLLYFWGMTVLTLSILRYLTPIIGLSFVVLPGLGKGLGTHRFQRAGVRRRTHAGSDAYPGIMHLTDTLDGGGAERMAVNLVNHLPRGDYRVFLCTTRRDGVLDDAVRQDVERLRLQRRGRFDLKAIRALARFNAENDIQLLHAHNTSLFIALASSFFPPFPKVIWHHHTGRFALEDRAARIYKLAARRISGVITVTQELADWTQRRLGVPAHRVRYIPNFVSEARVEETPELPGTPGARIVCVANLHADKDQRTLLQAMAQIVRRFPQAHLLLVGEAREAEFLQSLKTEIETLGLGSSVTLMGQRKDVAGVLKGCDIGALSSVSEGLPMALIEYGFAGLPAVATEVGQCSDVLNGGKAGILVPPRNPEKLAEALMSLLESAELRRAMGEAFSGRVREAYSAQAVIAQVCRFYQAVS
ncbi:MAG TPA: glycosyltransferase [Blastocatellia bacterium]|nr:glycosyltransferase [Blastocatellia bacterium]